MLAICTSFWRCSTHRNLVDPLYSPLHKYCKYEMHIQNTSDDTSVGTVVIKWTSIIIDFNVWINYVSTLITQMKNINYKKFETFDLLSNLYIDNSTIILCSNKLECSWIWYTKESIYKYIFLKFQWWCSRYKYFPNQRSGVQGFGSAPQPRAVFRNPEPNTRRHAWGTGNVLGGN